MKQTLLWQALHIKKISKLEALAAILIPIIYFISNAEITAKIHTGGFSPNSQYLYVSVYICLYIYTHTHKIGFLEDLWKRLWKLEEHFHFHVGRASAAAKYRILHCRWTRSEKSRKQRLVGPACAACLRYLPACPLQPLCPWPASPALESQQSRTSIDESGNRHREVLSKSWASSSVNWAVVSRAASMAWRMNQRRPEGVCGQSGRKENNTYNR